MLPARRSSTTVERTEARSKVTTSATASVSPTSAPTLNQRFREAKDYAHFVAEIRPTASAGNTKAQYLTAKARRDPQSFTVSVSYASPRRRRVVRLQGDPPLQRFWRSLEACTTRIRSAGTYTKRMEASARHGDATSVGAVGFDDVARVALNRRPDTADLSFDKRVGYIKRFYLWQDEKMDDFGWGVTISDFRAR
jgi:hypothetical protein